MPNRQKKNIFEVSGVSYICGTAPCLAYLLIFIAFCPASVDADRNPIRKLLNSDTLHDKTQRPKSSEQQWPASDNYKLLLEGHRKGGMLLDWLETAEIHFEDSERRVKRRASHIEALVKFLFKGKELNLVILLPEPRSQQSAGLRVIEAFKEADPPSFMVHKEEKLTINGKEWRSFATSGNRCSLTYSFRYEGILALSQTKCSGQPDILKEAAAGLNIERLESKLLL